MAIQDELLFEGFAGRGLGQSGVASRAIQASAAPSLRSALTSSLATQRELARQHASASKAQELVARSKTTGGMGKVSGSAAANAPIILGRTTGSRFRPGQVSVAIPTADGSFQVRSFNISKAGMSPRGRQTQQDIAALKGLGINLGAAAKAPRFRRAFSGTQQLSQADLMRRVMQSADPQVMSGLMKQIQSVPGGGRTAGSQVPFRVFPSAAQRKAESVDIAKSAEEMAAQKRMREIVYPAERKLYNYNQGSLISTSAGPGYRT